MKKKWIAITALILIAVMVLGALAVSGIMDRRKTLGLTLSAKDATSTSVTLECVRKIGFVAGSVKTGSAYTLEQETELGWQKVPQLPDYKSNWSLEATEVAKGANQWQLNLAEIYGELPPGTYRICKSFFTDREGRGSGRAVTLYAEFVVE